MAIKLNEFDIPKKEYINIKKLAYEYYEIYKNLSRKEQRNFLHNIKELDSPAKTLILKNTLIFPDTEKLLTTPQGKLNKYLKYLLNDEPEIIENSIMGKQLEYSMQNTQQLVAEGTLLVMEEKQYAIEDIGIKKYHNLKQEALSNYSCFSKLALSKKLELLEGCIGDWNYEDKIQLSTLLLPNDAELMQEMNGNTLEEIASKYKLPVELLEFKQQEYELQDTQTLIQMGKLKNNFRNVPLDYDEKNDFIIESVWNQSFYKSIQKELVKGINSKLTNMYKSHEVKTK